MAYGGTVVFTGIFQQVPEAIAILQPLLAILFFICDHTTHDIFTRLLNFVASNWGVLSNFAFLNTSELPLPF